MHPPHQQKHCSLVIETMARQPDKPCVYALIPPHLNPSKTRSADKHPPASAACLRHPECPSCSFPGPDLPMLFQVGEETDGGRRRASGVRDMPTTQAGMKQVSPPAPNTRANAQAASGPSRSAPPVQGQWRLIDECRNVGGSTRG